MTTRTLFLSAVLTVVLTSSAFADTVTATTRTSTSPVTTTTTTTTPTAKSGGLSEMPDVTFPGAAELQDKDKDGIVDSEQKAGGAVAGAIPDPFAPSEDEKKPDVKYVYKPTSSTMLRRSIQDDRIEDGYVQSLMQQNGPKD